LSPTCTEKDKGRACHTTVSCLQKIFEKQYCHHPAWKEATITAIFKRGDRKLPNNYHPISLTSIFCRMLESILHQTTCFAMSSMDLEVKVLQNSVIVNYETLE